MLDVAPHLSLAVLLSWLQFQISGQLAQQGPVPWTPSHTISERASTPQTPNAIFPGHISEEFLP